MLDNYKKTQNESTDMNDFNSKVSSTEHLIKSNEADTTIHFGFIAQELRKVYPNLVYEDEYGYLSVNYICSLN